ncbi:hypothetical protein EsVE80_19760 [Enterococcus saigonensis]|uniref:Haloacid dehalogenase n=1 Tax=Enterococcus saigonensis TaxID=1805431 RepID=A0A679IE51_9ENTE|nr:Cof-type HAD-IIB family hydrolase [Enterococcus saigonensis]BCA86453.1 hypothetical protein EsVE80_19760 [Enterococcus saigonensis]
MVAVKVVMSDVDGTILNSHHQISDRLKAVVKKLTKRDIPFVLASARSPEGMKQIGEELEISDAPLVAFNGALVLQDHAVIFSQPLAKRDVRTILTQINRHFPTIAINLYSENKWYVDKMDDYVKLESEITKITPQIVDLVQLPVKLPVHKLLLIGDEAEIVAVKKFLEPQMSTSALYLSKENYLEVTHQTVSKAVALSAISNYYQITTTEIMAFGDNYNDSSMLQVAGIGIAMGNAPHEVKKAADKITKTNDEDGVADVLAELL